MSRAGEGEEPSAGTGGWDYGGGAGGEGLGWGSQGLLHWWGETQALYAPEELVKGACSQQQQL